MKATMKREMLSISQIQEEKTMKSINKLFKALTALVIAAVIIAGIMPAMSAEAATGRLSVSTERLWLNGPGSLKVTIKDRAEDDSIRAWINYSGAADIEIGEWDGDTCEVTLTPNKDQNARLFIEAVGEKQEIKLYMKLRRNMSSEEIYQYAHDAVVEIETYDREDNLYIGAGFFVGDGLVLTNHHVVEAAKSIKITDYNGKTYKLKKVVGYDEVKDLILFQVYRTNKAAFDIAEDAVGGQRIYSFGSPLCITGTFAQGMVANPHVEMYETDFVQLAMPSGIGSGGGPIIDEEGRVVGVMCRVVTSAQNMSFAVDYNEIRAFMGRLTAEDAMSLKKFYKTTRGKTKESNFHNIIESTTEDNSSIIYTGKLPEKSSTEIYAAAHDAMVAIVGDAYVLYPDNSIKLEEYPVGSGFFIAPDTIVTNEHVVSATYVENMRAIDYNGHTYNFEKVNKSMEYDLALIQVSCEDGLDKHTSLEVWPGYIPSGGETVYSFGNPEGFLCTFADGVVAASTRTFTEFQRSDKGYADGLRFIHFTAPISPGSSGGPLLNKYGKVIGVNSIMVIDTEGNNYAIQIDQLSMLK